MQYYFSDLKFSCYEWKNILCSNQTVKKIKHFPGFSIHQWNEMKIMNEYLGLAMVSFPTANVKSQKWTEKF